MSALRIEPARPRDLARVAELAKASLADPWSEDGFAVELANDHALLLVAREGDAPAGARAVGYLVAHRVADQLHVLSLAVDVARRRRGIAGRLLACALGGARTALLEVRPTSVAARALYARFGFRETGRRPRYYADGEDALLMTLGAHDARPPRRTSGRVISNHGEGASRTLCLEIGDWPGAAPGQFVMLSAGALAAVPRFDPLLPRPMAVYRSTPGRDGGARVEILYKVSGRGTALLAAARPGEAIGVMGPLGRGFAAPAPGGDAILVGGGTGIASLFDLAASAQTVGRVRVLLGARTARDLLGVSDFEALGVPLSVATEDGSRGRQGLVTALLDEALASWPRATVYACGPTPMMRRAAELAEKAGCPCVVSLENPMACGFGVCLGCATPRADGGFALVCRDGPVFAAGEIDWERLG